MSKETGGPAFPSHGIMDEVTHEGMTMRYYFAAKTMRIMWEAYDKGYCGVLEPDTGNDELISEGAYHMADAMLEARSKP